jgi:predicted MFS family arabinose efflux permease
VNALEPGMPGATGLLERPDPRRIDDGPDTTASTMAIFATQIWATLGIGMLTLIEFLRQKSAALDIARTDELAPTGPKRSNWQALKYSIFGWYFAGSVVSNLGTWLQNAAQVVLAYQLTHSVFMVGLVTCAQFTSPLVLGAWAGVVTQWLGNWTTLIVTQATSMAIAAALAGLEFSGALTISWLLTGALLIGLSFTFALPALSVTVAGLVSPNEPDRPLATKRALAMDSVSYNLGRALAPAFSVVLLVTIGVGWAFAFNAVSFCFFTLVLLFLRRCGARSDATRSRSRVKDGFSIAWHDRRIMILLLMVAAVTVAADPILVLGPALAHHFRVSPDWSGIFIAALGAGNVSGSLRRTHRPPSIRRAATVLCILSLSMVTFVVSPWIWLSVAAAFAAGLACLMAGALTRVLLLEYADANQASVMAVWAIAWAGSKPIASLVDGSLAGTFFGLKGTGILLALPALLPALVLLCLPKRVEKIRARAKAVLQPVH